MRHPIAGLIVAGMLLGCGSGSGGNPVPPSGTDVSFVPQPADTAGTADLQPGGDAYAQETSPATDVTGTVPDGSGDACDDDGGPVGLIDAGTEPGDAQEDFPADDLPAAGDPGTTTDGCTLADVATADQAPPAEDVVTADETPPAEDVAAADETPPAEDVTTADETPPAEDVATADETPPAEDVATADETPPAEDVATADGPSLPDAGQTLPPILNLPVDELVFTAISGEFASAPVEVIPQNTGEGELFWSAQTDADWLEILPAQGGPGAGFVVTVLPEQVPPGSDLLAAAVVVQGAVEGVTPASLSVRVETVATEVGPFVTQFGYDMADRLTSTLWADGSKTEYVYANGDLPVELIWPDGSVLQRQYDEWGRPVHASGPQGQMDFSWNDRGLLSQLTYPDAATFSLTYDAARRITALGYPDQTAVSYSYDDRGLLAAVSSPAGTTKLDYDAEGRMTKRLNPGGTATLFEYDEHGRPSALETRAPGGTLIVRHEQTFDGRGLRASMTEATPQETLVTQFEYDPVGRLTTVTGPEGVVTYEYDLAGRRVARQGPDGLVTYSYDRDGRMVRAGDMLMRYDDRGRMVERVSPDETVSLAYDDADHLVSVSGPAGDLEYGYAADGTRHWRKEGKTVEWEYQAELGGLSRILYRKGKGGVATRYVYGPGWLTEEPEGQPARILAQDLLGNVSRVLSSGGAVLATCRYGAFGEPLADACPVGYHGEAQDPLTGFVHLRAREYDPALGLFLSRDPGTPVSTDAETLDRYRFAASDPINYTDPNGEEAKKVEIESIEDAVKFMQNEAKGAWILDLVADLKMGIVADVKVELKTKELELGLAGKNGSLDLSGLDGCKTFPGAFNTVPKDAVIKNQMFPFEKVLEYDFHVDSGAKGFLPGKELNPTAKGDVWIKMTITGDVYSLKFDQGKGPGGKYDKGYYYPGGGPPGGGGPGGFGGGPGGSGGKGPGGGFFSSPKGGVSLDKAAVVLANLGDISGAVYDPATGQLVLYGPGTNVLLPQMAMDDVVAAYRAVFLHPEEAPGVTMGNVPPPAGFENEQGVKYFGGVDDTYIGWAFFEADRQLKVYSLGEDNVTHQPVVSQVPGYLSMLQRSLDGAAGGEVQNRMWFVPDNVVLGMAPDDPGAMVFTAASLKVLTEAKMLGGVIPNADGEEFAAHFTQYYDQFAQEQPILEELRRIMKVVSVLQWMRDQGIPLEADWLARYDLPVVATPYHTPTHTVSATNASGSTVFTVTGGVEMDVENTYDAAGGALAVETAQKALAARPDEATQTWPFQALNTDLLAVALHPARVERAGLRYLSSRDGYVRVPGGVPLAVERFCAPFDVVATELGYCWELRPHALRMTGGQKLLLWPGMPGGRGVPLSAAWLDRRHHRQVDFTYEGSVGSRVRYRPAWEADGLLYLEPDDRWTLETVNGKALFDADGQLQWEEDPSANRATYVLDAEGRTILLEHSSGLAVAFDHDAAGRILSAAFPDGTTVSYAYDGKGNLATVLRPGLPPEVILSDNGHVPVQVEAGAGSPAAQYAYDFLGRVSYVGLPDGQALSIEYGDLGHRVTVTDTLGRTSLMEYDQDMRFMRGTGPLGSTLTYTYAEGSAGPVLLTDAVGRETSFAYDTQGHLAGMEDPEGASANVFYVNGLPVGLRRNGGLADTYVQRDAQGRVIAQYDRATLKLNNGKLVGASFTEPPTTTEYDQSGQVVSVTDPAGLPLAVAYDAHGNVAEVDFPSGLHESRQHDAQGRVTALERSDGSQVKLSYHPNGIASAVTLSYGSYLFDVDAQGHVLSVTDPAGAETSYTWSQTGQLVGVVAADGGQVSYLRDELGRLVQATDISGWGLAVERDLAGRVTFVVSGHLD